jgi:hypothetical protein
MTVVIIKSGAMFDLISQCSKNCHSVPKREFAWRSSDSKPGFFLPDGCESSIWLELMQSASEFHQPNQCKVLLRKDSCK